MTVLIYIVIAAMLAFAALCAVRAFQYHMDEVKDKAHVAGYNEAMYEAYYKSVDFRVLGMIGSGNNGQRVTLGWTDAISREEFDAKHNSLCVHGGYNHAHLDQI